MANDTDRMSDRDLLVRIDTKMENIEPRLIKVEDRLTALELRDANDHGMFKGAKALWTLLAAAPLGLGAYIAGGGQVIP